MEISQEFVNNELLSTLIAAFICCYTIYVIVNFITTSITDLICYFVNIIKKD